MAAFDYLATDGDVPQASIEIVAIAFLDEALASPLMDGALGYLKPLGDLFCSQHAALDQSMSAAG